MLVVSTRELMQNQNKFFELANNQRIIIKRKSRFFQLIDLGNSIPEYNPSPSGDAYFLNPKNIAAIEKSDEQIKKGEVKKYSLKKLKEKMRL
ncbi:MAG: hypothetical protein LBQ31_01865 [Bacteroidales bacterium]|jgi:hypothetical protein|nr:hypothetical protein [Bacteroidales bacterium]